jgi:hypothetical protein
LIAAFDGAIENPTYLLYNDSQMCPVTSGTSLGVRWCEVGHRGIHGVAGPPAPGALSRAT